MSGVRGTSFGEIAVAEFWQREYEEEFEKARDSTGYTQKESWNATI